MLFSVGFGFPIVSEVGFDGLEKEAHVIFKFRVASFNEPHKLIVNVFAGAFEQKNGGPFIESIYIMFLNPIAFLREKFFFHRWDM
jgi:hypothetical protein